MNSKVSISLALILFVGTTVFSQDNNAILKLKSVNISIGEEQLYPSNQSVNSYANTVHDQSIFVQNDSALTQSSNINKSSYFNYSIEVALAKDQSKWTYIFGASINDRVDRFNRFWKEDDYIIDTVYTVVPYLSSSGNGQPNYSTQYDTLLLDSISRHELNIVARTTNVYVYGEALRDFVKNKYTFSVGGGLAIGASVRNNVSATYDHFYGLRMVKESGGYYEPVWYADIPEFNPVQGTYNVLGLTRYSEDVVRTKANHTFILKPYIPLRVEAVIAKDGFFSNLGVQASGKAGYEFQIVKNGGIKSRFFWGVNTGVFYRL